MPTNMTLAQFAQYQLRVARHLPDFVAKAERVTVTDAMAAAVKLSSGTLKTKTLRRMGHPYAKRSPQTLVDPAIINVQSGKFRAAWKKSPQILTGKTIISGIANDSLPAKFMLKGTKKMVARPIDDAVKLAVAPRRKARLIAAVNKAIAP